MLASHAWCAVWGIGLSMAASAQEATVRATVSGPPGTRFGADIAVLDDLNGDGCNEFAVGAPLNDDWAVDSGMVRIFSGADLSIYWEGKGWYAGDHFGEAVTNAGDVNGDWYPDLLVGAPGRAPDGAAFVYSGEWMAKTAAGQTPLTAYELYMINPDLSSWTNANLGSTVLGNLNINNDGYADFLIGAPSFGYDLEFFWQGLVASYSGQTGLPIWTATGQESHWRFGSSLARIRAKNNFSGDTLQDYLVGAPDANRVRLLSGAAGNVLWSFGHYPDFGTAIAVPGDTTGDDKDEWVMSQPGPDFDGASRIYVLYSEHPYWSYIGAQPPTKKLGLDLAAAGDINLDGFPDFVASSDMDNPELYSLVDLELLDILPNAPPTYLPSVVAGGGDLDGDGLNDVLAGDPENDTVVLYDTSGLVVPAFVDEAWFIGTPGLPVTYAIIKYPTWAFAGQTAQIEVQFDHGAGFVLGHSASFVVPVGDPPQREHVAKITHPAPFTLGGTYQYRVRMWVAGTTPGAWSQPTAGHPAADRAKPKNVVDVVDLGLFMGSWMLQEGDPGYDPLSNFDQVGKVDVVDFAILWTQWKPIINQE